MLSLSLPSAHEHGPFHASKLADDRWLRYIRLNELCDVNDAVVLYRQSLQHTSRDHPGRPSWLYNLGRCLYSKFSVTGKLRSLSGSIFAFRGSVESTLDEHDPALPQRFSGLAVGLHARVMRLGETRDLEDALDASRRAVELTTIDNPELPWRLSNLAKCLSARFERLGKVRDLQNCIRTCQHALELTSGNDPELPQRLVSLARSFRSRFKYFGELDDLEYAADVDRRAIELTSSDDEPELSRRLNNLAVFLRTRYKRFGEPRDLDSAIEACRRTVVLTPDDHPDRSQRMLQYGSCMYSRFLKDGTRHNFDAIVECYMEASQMRSSSDPRWCFRCAEACIKILSDHPEFSSLEYLFLAYSRIIDTLPDLAWSGYMQYHFDESTRIGRLVSAAVCAAIQTGDTARAVQWLEAGRNLTVSQVISRRSTPLDQLAERLTGLAHSVRSVRMELQQLGDKLHPDRESHTLQQHRQLMMHYDDILKDIRTRDNFEDFMRPKKLTRLTFSSMTCGPTDGTVVFINVARSSCDSLLLLFDGTVKPVKLPDLSETRAGKLRDLWIESVCDRRAHTRRGSAPRESASIRGYSNIYSLILGRLWAWIVYPILQALGVTQNLPDATKPHIIWCLSGALTDLPLHAAGLYNQMQTGPRVFDYVVSSYTTSLSSLLRCVEIESSHHATLSPSMLLVAQTENPRPGLTPLHHVREESARLRALFEESKHTFLENEQATAKATLSGIYQHSWVHFACHGSQYPRDPSFSSLELYDKALTIADLWWTASDNAELAFLSACETAAGGQRVPEEFGHFAMGMLAIGFKGVVATMWAICDEDGPVIVEAYYKKLLELRASGAVPRGQTGAAYALHHAVGCLREAVGESKFERWVPFVHFGV
ncbi:hypothetical protein PENSPDRAFT_718411 [Peniophora sp. CONT]|nr:hypothetical protein PENSPDRAFT_718411 [Peniophora sp. CONT]